MFFKSIVILSNSTTIKTIQLGDNPFTEKALIHFFKALSVITIKLII